MRILVDGDGCPVNKQIEELAKERKIPVFIFIDTSHIMESDYCGIIQVSKGADSVDFALINQARHKDIVVTGDYGLATMALAKQCIVINFRGKHYTNQNIESFLFERHLSKKMRRNGIYKGNMKKRTKADDLYFKESLKNILDQSV
ncbi:MAG TPA: YaiI/YqxD family protein [Firmicutes bacterium]|nr:YaiI/YqxD family protein [Bacillales bacterium]HJA41566.1 YaiI/YqxD family protein [Bacillota bacterium]